MTRLLLLWLLTSALASKAGERPQLQILNGSSEPLSVYWVQDNGKRLLTATVPAGGDRVISTTLGHQFTLVSGGVERQVKAEVPLQGYRFDSVAPDGIPAFYTQRQYAHGYPIVASSNVNPYALKEAAHLIDMMLSGRPDVRAAMIKSGSRMCIMACTEYSSDLPEFSRFAAHCHPDFPKLSGRDYWDARARGTGSSERDPYCTCAEENLLGYPGDPYEQECILIHEFAHCIHLRGMANVDPTFDARVKAAYDAAMKAGLWRAAYASTNHHEYFAEGVQTWFNNNRRNDHDHNHVHLRSQLVEYDPALTAALCREVFGDTEIAYTKPATRLTGHLAGYQPSQAPTFVWPERLLLAKKAIHAAILRRNEAALKQR